MEEKETKTKEQRIEELSQKIFGKPSKDIKYLLVTNYIHKQLLDEEVTRTGLYQWLNVFKGEIKNPQDVKNFNDYDIIQVNFAPQDVPIIYQARKSIGKDSKTKIVVNNDFTSELWSSSFNFPVSLEQALNDADMIFGTEYFQVTGLSEIAQRKVYVIPHPADIKRLKSLTPLPKKPIISTVWRRYDNFAYVPSLAVRNHGLRTQLIGYDKDKDPRVWMTTALYDDVYAGTNYFEFCDQLRQSQIVYDPFTFHSFSRATVDTAAMGVAVVGSNRTQSSQLCYPHTSIDPYDVAKARELIGKLIEDKEFYDLVVKTALERSEFYNHINSKERYLMALSDALFAGDNWIVTEKKERPQDKGIGTDVLDLKAKELNDENAKEEKFKKAIKGES